MQESSSAAIGVFDSGVGGLSILAGIRRLLPHENLVYVADSANAPYGTRGEAYIRARSEALAGFLLAQGAKALVLACNTATAAAIAELRQRHRLPIIGVEPALKPAASQSRSGVVGVLATSGTIASDKFLHLQSRFSEEVEVLTRACNGLVEEIERLEPDPAVLRSLLEGFIEPLRARGADTLVLGCTHYSLIKPLIEAVAGPGIQVLDAGDAVARELQRRLTAEGLENKGAAPGSLRFYSSGNPEQQSRLFARYWPGSECPVVEALGKVPESN